jgi:hypothetical protein
MISSPLSPMLVRLAGKSCTVEDGSNRPRPEWVWCGGGEGKPGGGSLEDGAPIRSSGSLSKRVSRYLCDHINTVAYETGEFVRKVRIGEGFDQGNGWHKWSVSYLPRLAGEGVCE